MSRANQLYYSLKPIVPRWLQIQMRRQVIRRQREKYAHLWPIDERAGLKPEGWAGWPEGKRFALVLTHDVETQEGQAKCIRLAELEESLEFKSSFNFTANQYEVSLEVQAWLRRRSFEVGLHGLYHDGDLFRDRMTFEAQAREINRYLRDWGVVGFRCPSMYHNLKWIGELNIEYDASTFDTDPFEPQPDGMRTIFPFCVRRENGEGGYVELPYTLPQDFTLFVLMKEKGIEIWKRKLDWVAEKGGMALVISHPDYMNFNDTDSPQNEYPASYYKKFLEYIKENYDGQYWNVLPKDMARYWGEIYGKGIRSRRFGANRQEETKKEKHWERFHRKKIWIDLDNSPHVPFFSPIVKELERSGCQVFLTARDCSQTCGLADLFHMRYKRIGRHYGRHKLLKVAGTIFRALQLFREMKNARPALAISHGSRAQMLSAWMLHIPSLAIMDYEHVKGFLNPTWIMMPEVISKDAIKHDKNRIFHYPGIKEDVYIPTFKPNPAIREELGIGDGEMVVTIRPPATEAHYHNPESEDLFSEVVNLLGDVQNVRMVILPRNESQETAIRREWSEWNAAGKIIIPKQVVDGLNLLWHSDVVISGGGTMNREAAALAVPVYSIFRGRIGAVDQYLAKTGRLTLLESVEDVHKKLVLARRTKPVGMQKEDGRALICVVEGIIKALETDEQKWKSRKGR